jgi:hypothetical protein
MMTQFEPIFAVVVPFQAQVDRTVTGEVVDSDDKPVASGLVSDGMPEGPARWHKVEKGAAVTIDPIDTPSFAIKLRDQTSVAKPGDEIFLQPALYTGDGPLIVVAYCGNPVSPALQETLGARIALVTADAAAVATAHSGFS